LPFLVDADVKQSLFLSFACHYI